ncbi:MAG: hypothetical protein WBA89_02130 [Microcoleus sp.]|uniref:hypothetical protein n=1 Tax=Microcoleus sp. TaxID=44472 RepID=UPI003C7596B1
MIAAGGRGSPHQKYLPIIIGNLKNPPWFLISVDRDIIQLAIGNTLFEEGSFLSCGAVTASFLCIPVPATRDCKPVSSQ